MRLRNVGNIVFLTLFIGVACKPTKNSREPRAVPSPKSSVNLALTSTNLGDEDAGALATFAVWQHLSDENPASTALLDRDVTETVSALKAELQSGSSALLNLKNAMLELYDKNDDGRITSDELAIIQAAIQEKLKKSRTLFVGGWHKQEYQICSHAERIIIDLKEPSSLTNLYLRIAAHCEKLALPDSETLDRTHLCASIRINGQGDRVIFPFLHALLDKCAATSPSP